MRMHYFLATPEVTQATHMFMFEYDMKEIEFVREYVLCVSHASEVLLDSDSSNVSCACMCVCVCVS